MLEVADCLKLD